MIFLFSVQHCTPEGHLKLQGLRLAVRSLNRIQKKKVQVVVKPIKGKNNRHAWKYKAPNDKRRWRLEDAHHLDVYLKKKG